MDFDLDDTPTLKETAGKYFFWDIDGTLTPYRFNGHVGDPNGTNNGQSQEEIENGLFFQKRPSKHMQHVLKTCQAKKHIIMGHCISQKEIADKHLWIRKHYPMITEVLLTEVNVSKAKTIMSWCAAHQIDLSEVVFVDDVIPYLREAEKEGILSYHISSFLDWNL